MNGFTIAIATYNRSAELRRTLTSLAALRTSCQYEILVIANRCTDDTVAVVVGMEPLFSGRLRRIEEQRQGLSVSRNRAAAEAKFSIIAYLDDDVDVDPGWLDALDSAYASGDIAAVGGRAHLVYPGQRPRWLGEADEGYLTKVDLGDYRRPALADELYGVNLSIKTEWVQRVGGFRTDLGRVGNCLVGDEEGELLQRIIAGGGNLLYEPRAIVGHRVAPARLNRKWFWRRCFEGHRGTVNALSSGRISAYELLRASWRVLRPGLTSAGALALRGPTSQAFFHTSVIVTARAGVWVGTVSRWVSETRTSLGPSPRMPGEGENVV